MADNLIFCTFVRNNKDTKSMRRIFIALIMCIPMIAYAQTEPTSQDRVAALQAEAAAKAKAAQEAAKAAQEAAIAAQKAAEAAMQEAKKAEAEAKTKAEKQAKEAKKGEAETKAEAGKKAKYAAVEKENAARQTETNATQSNTWTAPAITAETPDATETEKKEDDKQDKDDNKSNIYLAEDAVPLVDGKVQWVYELDIPGKSAKQIYGEMLQFLSKITKEENQLERSKVALVNEKDYKIAATMQEWLVFSSSFLSLDRTKLSYVIYANCSEGHLQVILDRISYVYGEGKDTAHYKAEEWITDKYSVNKKRTRLYPISGKFRRKTIDRKNEIFNEIKVALL